MPERLLRRHGSSRQYPPLNHDDRFGAAQQGGDAGLEVVEGVAMLYEDCHLLTGRGGRSGNGCALFDTLSRSLFHHPIRDRCCRNDFAEEACEPPLHDFKLPPAALQPLAWSSK